MLTPNRLSRLGLLVLALAAPAAATDVGNRFLPITSFQDERNVKIVNDNFRRVTANMIDGKLVNQGRKEAIDEAKEEIAKDVKKAEDAVAIPDAARTERLRNRFDRSRRTDPPTS